jgi:hypothetical protein
MDAVESAMLQRRSHSLGGAVVIRYAAEHPERVDQLFLLDSAGLHGKATIAAVQPKTREEARQTVRNVSGTNFRRLPGFILDDVVWRAQPVWLGAWRENRSHRLTDRRWVRGMGMKMNGAKVLGKYEAPRLKRSGALPSASQSADVSGWLSFKSALNALSALSYSSILSFVSIGSIGSAGSILSIGSVGSILSIGSAGSILSIGSAGSILSIGKAGAAPGRGSVEPEAEILLEEEELLPEEEILIEEMPPRPMP